MDMSLSGQTSIFGGIFFVFKSLLGIERQKKLNKKFILDPKASVPCQNIDIWNVAKHRVMFVHVTFFVVKYSKRQMSCCDCFLLAGVGKVGSLADVEFTLV